MEKYQRLDALLQHFVEHGPAGVALNVSQNNETLYENYVGYSDIEADKLIKSDSIYRIYSMTKVITCVAAMTLYERGLFLLNDPLETYLPEFKNGKVALQNGELIAVPVNRPILIKDLFMMTSGIPYGGNNTESERQIALLMNKIRTGDYDQKKTAVRALSEGIGQVPLEFHPGTSWKYGLNHDILGALIEVLSGQTFGEFLKEKVFNPLGMVDTSFVLPAEKRDRLCTLYDRSEDGSLSKNESLGLDLMPAYESGGGGLFSTLKDYTRFAQMLAGGGELEGVRILSEKTIQLMATDHLNEQEKEAYNWDYLKGYSYGLGVRIMVNRADGGINGSLGEFGWCGLAGTWVLIDPKEKLSAVYMQQMLPNFEAYHQPRLRNVIYGLL